MKLGTGFKGAGAAHGKEPAHLESCGEKRPGGGIATFGGRRGSLRSLRHPAPPSPVLGSAGVDLGAYPR